VDPACAAAQGEGRRGAATPSRGGPVQRPAEESRHLIGHDRQRAVPSTPKRNMQRERDLGRAPIH